MSPMTKTPLTIEHALLDFLGKASKLPEYTETYSPTVLKNVVSYEENVKAVLSKITLNVPPDLNYYDGRNTLDTISHARHANT